MRFALSLTAATLAACASGDAGTASSSPVESCRVRLPPRVATTEPAPPSTAPPVKRPSRWIADVDLALGPILAELERSVPPRLAEERGRSIGVAGSLDYTADRGPLSLSVEGDALIVRTDVRAHAEACRGRSCYASCDPQGRATATVPLRLGPDYRFAPSRVTFAFTRGCTVRALGGMLKIDVTDTVQGALAPSLRRVEREIDGKLPSMRKMAEKMWSELGKSRPLPLGGCIVPSPEALIEGPIASAPGRLRARIGVVAYPEMRSRCGEASAARPLPPLAQDPTLPPDDDLVVTFVSPLASIGPSLESADPFDVGGARARIARAAVAPDGDAARLDLDLQGEACGAIGVRSGFAWSDDGRALVLRGAAFDALEAKRVDGAGLSSAGALRSFGGVRLAPPVQPDALKDIEPAAVASMADPTVTVNARVVSVKPLDVTLREGDLAASVAMRGHVEIVQR